MQCIECEREFINDERGWQAHLLDAEDGGDEVAVYCPVCASREFGPDPSGDDS